MKQSTSDLVVLGIDIGSRNLGYCIIDFSDFSIKESGTWYLSEDNISLRQLAYYNKLVNLIQKYKVSYLAYEMPMIRKGSHVMDINFISATTSMAGAFCKLKLIQKVSPSSVKKKIANNGRANKEEVENAVQTYFNSRKLPLTFSTNYKDHETDAFAITLFFYETKLYNRKT